MSVCRFPKKKKIMSDAVGRPRVFCGPCNARSQSDTWTDTSLITTHILILINERVYGLGSWRENWHRVMAQ